MKYSIVVLGAPHSSQCASTAINFCRAALKKGHDIYRVFFYYDGVQNANSLSTPPQDEINITESWKRLQEEFDLDLVVCIAAAVKRGLLDSTESNRHEKTGQSLSDGFELSGLGQLIDATHNSDRLITFGP